ncbi:N-acetyl-alpha-D-glucosaminyl L-malate synthase BshA [Candidatus Sumerlaeota bacterium]|nr:N-acetyl-alpha-D-glucosaminyl L-malate synthase BshA [Candidatus Sumerlaeota bacterium]
MKMKIGIVCYPTYGGSGTIAAELGCHLAVRGHHIHFMSFALPFRLKQRCTSNIKYHPVDLSTYEVLLTQPYTLTLASKIAEVVEREELEILHVHYAIPHTISALLARQILRRKIKIVTTLHGTDITLVGQMPSYRPIIKLAIEHSDVVTCVSQWLKKRTQECFQPRKRLKMIYNFVDVERFKPFAEKCKPRPALFRTADKIIMHASNFRPLKRPCDLIRAFAIIQEKVKSRLILIGDGPEHQRAVQLAKDLGIRRKVRTIGQVNDPENFFPYADIFLMSSEIESFGLTAAEAMSCGVPVVGTRVGGLCEVVDDGVNGYLVPPGDYRALADKSITILQNPCLHRSMSTKAREKILKKFSPHKIVGQIELMYYRLLGEQKR